MAFDGFTLPDGAWLPPELIYLLPHLSEAKLKILLVILYQNLQVEANDPVSLTDLENMTGLASSTVAANVKTLLDDQIIYRERIGRSYAYRPAIAMVRNSDLKLSKLRESDSKLNIKDSLTDSLNYPDGSIGIPDGPKFVLLVRDLRAAGVYLKTAQAIIAQHDEDYIRRHLDYYKHALSLNIAQGPGWLVLSCKEDWPAPLGYEEKTNRMKACPDCGGVWFDSKYLHHDDCTLED